ncbi:uncharacterized protein LOC142316938 [Anomaloglossus baeobatrachus]|uniref:uncharacterized protein LOC142316938 n=1 Tax=Anomaloglossus baeobatrachus TaxID=238106 RepID=UPI003F503BB1
MNLVLSLILLGSVVLGCDPEPGDINIARYGEASQHSDLSYPMIGYANNAIDGRKYAECIQPCTHTKKAENPWWKLDLKVCYKISNVILRNRVGYYKNRLLGAEVRIGNSPDNNNPVCGNVTDVTSETLPFCCKGMEGRYVSVVIPGRSEYLTLCAVEIYGDFNIAKRGEASQQSDLQHEVMGYAKNAIDGGKETNYYLGSCSHTNQVKDPWWKLDLNRSYKISYVVLTNRMDCCKDRLMGAEVRIGNSPDNNNPVCGKVRNVTSATLSFCCDMMEGQYVSVVIPGRTEFLTLCEVEVYADIDCTPKGSNIAINGEASQQSDLQNKVMGYAKNAIDGVKDPNYNNGSCTHTNQVKNPWWKLDLTQTYKISNVVITNRQDCCKERLMGAEVRIGDSPNNVNPVCGRVTNVTSATLSFCCNDMEGRYVSVVIPGRTEYLTLCEVEVYGEPVCPVKGTNVAKYGEASQQSDLQNKVMGYAKNAIDGVKTTDYNNGSCTHTNQTKSPWWRLDLKQNYTISNVVITNRQDCCKERLIGAEVLIGYSPDNNNPICGKVANVTSDTFSFCCNGMEGQYVSVVIPGRSEYLTLCEVEVYGVLVSEVPIEYNVCW